MARSNQYTKRNQDALHGSPTGEFEIELDLADGNAEVQIHDEFSLQAFLVSCQVVGTTLAGTTLNGSVTLTQSNDGENWDTISTSTTDLDASDLSDTIEKSEFSGKYLGASVDVGGITSGTVKLYFLVKHH